MPFVFQGFKFRYWDDKKKGGDIFFSSVLRRELLKIVFEAWITLYSRGAGPGAGCRGRIGTASSSYLV